MLNFVVPPGIGDISWCYSKLKGLSERRNIGFQSVNSNIARASEFINLLPNITNHGYHSSYWYYSDEWRNNLLPHDTDISTLPDGTYNLCLNPYLEAGMKLAEIFPKQETVYHYRLETTERQRKVAGELLAMGQRGIRFPNDGVSVGFYCSSYDHAKANQFWDVEEWRDFLLAASSKMPHMMVTYYAIGAGYDRKTQHVFDMLLREDIGTMRMVPVFGYSLGVVVELLRGLGYFFSFPSGLAMLSDVVNTPCMMWYFNKNDTPDFINTYADPDHIRDGKHLNTLFCSVEESVNLFTEKGLPWLPK